MILIGRVGLVLGIAMGEERELEIYILFGFQNEK